jgi:hypothetical protein
VLQCSAITQGLNIVYQYIGSPWDQKQEISNRVEPRLTNLIRSWRPSVTRNILKPKLCVLSESYTATDTLPPMLPAGRQPLLPACVFVTRDTVRHPRLFFWENLFVNRFVRDERLPWTEVPLYCKLSGDRCWHSYILRVNSYLYFNLIMFSNISYQLNTV